MMYASVQNVVESALNLLDPVCLHLSYVPEELNPFLINLLMWWSQSYRFLPSHTIRFDSTTLANLLRMDLIPQAHMISEDKRGLRDLMRTDYVLYRAYIML